MIEREYLERLERDFAAQIRDYENNAAAARGALQVIQHLLGKYDEETAGNEAVSLPIDSELIKDKDNGTHDL